MCSIASSRMASISGSCHWVSVRKSGLSHLRPKSTEHSLVEVYDISILPIAPRIIELRVNEVVTHVDT